MPDAARQPATWPSGHVVDEGKLTSMSSPPSGRGCAVIVGVVGVGDGLDDGEAEAVPVGVADALAAGLLERLEESVDLARAG